MYDRTTMRMPYVNTARRRTSACFDGEKEISMTNENIFTTYIYAPVKFLAAP